MTTNSDDYSYYTEVVDQEKVEYLPLMSYDNELGVNVPSINSSLNDTGGDNITVPQPYEVWETVLISAITIPVIVGIIFGNVLVCIVIKRDRQLKTVQNWFIASLAIADLLVGSTIMPFTLANEVMGYWVFGSILCDLWLAADVLLCTSSILHLCLISLDRYWSIVHAVDYVRKRTPKRAALMIATVWILSAIICLPPLIGWKGPRDTSQYPTCFISEDVGYVVYSCMGSFYIPLCVIIIVYFKIYMSARERALRHINRNTNNKNTPQRTLLLGWCSCTRNQDTQHSHELNCLSKPPSSDSNEKEHNSDSDSTEYPSKDKIIGVCKSCDDIHKVIPDFPTGPIGDSSDTPPAVSDKPDANGLACKDIVEKSTENLQSTDDGLLCPPKKSGIRKHSDSVKSNRDRQNNERVPLTESASSRTKERNLEKQKRRIARAKERRATMVIMIVCSSFVVCWFPFFTLYMIATIAHTHISDPVFKFFFWLGYCNSGFNPVIYTIFNRDFKSAFYKLLCPRLKPT